MARRVGQRGGALLAVLWISAALTAIAFGVAATVRTETERTSTLSEGVRAWYLAAGAIERVWLYVQWGPGYRNPDGTPKFFEQGMARVFLNFPTGAAVVEVIPETAKLGLNTGRPEEILKVLMLLNIEPERAQQIVAAIVDWRSGVPGGLSMFDQFYMSLVPSFRARHASFEQTEELLLVRGMTPELYYGTAVQGDQGQLVPLPGLRDCLSVYGSELMIDVNHAEPAVLGAIGIVPEAVAEIVARRRVQPYKTVQELTPLMQFAGPGARRLMVGGSTIFTFRATARLRLPNGQMSDMSRTVSAMLKFHQKSVTTPPIEVLRWYDY
ncbi:MAG: type II secretion system protein GspK [Bryobacteraceae bacterium]|nr:type II secretion system protein GspK [Bryobacteraceae bacterium]